jgi:hypothetical protein
LVVVGEQEAVGIRGTITLMRELGNGGEEALRRLGAWGLWWGCFSAFYRAKRGARAVAMKPVRWAPFKAAVFKDEVGAILGRETRGVWHPLR